MTLGGKKIVSLPLGYVVNGKKHDEAEIRAMTGVEEDVLSDDKMPMTHRISSIILNCLERLGDVTDKAEIKKMIPKLSVDDQTALLVALRTISVGPMYSYTVDCPSCEVVIKFDLDLNSLKLTPAGAKESFEKELELPSGKKAKIHPMLIEDSAKVEQMRLQGDETLSVSIWVRLSELDGNKSPSVDDVRKLLYADRLHLRNSFDAHEGGVESEFQIKCNACSNKFAVYLDIVRSEFLHPDKL